MNVRRCLCSTGACSLYVMSIGMWSEDRSCSVCHEERSARLGEAKEMSGGCRRGFGVEGFTCGCVGVVEDNVRV